MQKDNAEFCSDCPLACRHIGRLIEDDGKATTKPRQSHPIEILARAYGVL